MGLNWRARCTAKTGTAEPLGTAISSTTDPGADESAASLAAVLFSQRSWQLRKVETRLFQEGSYSLTRVSIDCVPQALPGLRYELNTSASAVAHSSVLVPITYMQKGALRGFDMRDSNGNSMPVIGRAEYRQLMVDTLVYEVGPAAVERGDEATLRRALADVVDADRHEAEHVAEDLVVDGAYRGVRCIDPDGLSNYAANLILALADLYVLIALLPETQAGQRQVIKYEHHSTEEVDTRPERNSPSALARRLVALRDRLGITEGPVSRFRLAAGLDPLEVEFDLSHPAGATSHHFEMVIPAGLKCASLAMPVVAGQGDRNTVDTTPTGVAHAAAAYNENPDQGVQVQFRVPFEGLRLHTTLVCLLTAAILLLGLLLPGAQHALLRASDGAAALLLAIPAVVVALAVGGREHVMVARMLRPLRVVVIGCALLLLACAGSIVGVLHDGWRYTLWWGGAGAALVVAVILAWTALRSVVTRLRKTDDKSNGTGAPA